MTWLIYTITATAFFVVYDILCKILSTKSNNPVIFAGMYNVMAAFIALPFILLFPREQLISHIDTKGVIFLSLSILSWILFVRFEFLARKINEITIYLIIVKLAPIVTLFVSMFILDEKLTLRKLVAAALTLFANVLITVKNKSVKIKSGIVFSILTALFLGLGWTFDKQASSYFSLPIYTFIIFLIPGIVNLIYPKFSLESIKKEFKNSSLFSTFILAFVNIAGYLLMIKAMSLGQASKVVLIISSSNVIAFVLGIFLLKEQTRIIKKAVAGIGVLIATFLLA